MSKRAGLLLGAALSASVLTVDAAEFYVATSGSNANPGSLAQPWLTLQHAAGQVGPGDTVLVRGGQYDGFEQTVSGSAAQRIVFQAFPGEVPEVISNAPNRPDGINLEGASFITIDGFRIDGRGRAGIRAVNCEQVTVRNNHTDNNQRWGIFTAFCDDLLIENNITSRSRDEHGIYTSNSADRPIIRGNISFSNAGSGIHMNGDIFFQPPGGGADGIISGALIEANVLYDNGQVGGSALNMDGVQDSIVRNNLIYATHASGISLFRIDGGGPSSGNLVLNNTILVASDGRWAINIRNDSIDNTLRNNILYNQHSFRGSIDICPGCLSGFDSDYNAVMNRFTTNDSASRLTLDQWQAQTGQDQHSVVATPAQLFVDAGGDNYQLRANSPALDAGVDLTEVSVDLEGVSRPQGSATDIGAYETVAVDAGLMFRDGFEG